MAPEMVTPPVGGATSDGPQRPRRVRMSKPKVKTGCNNCKQRRIKCDEKRPACTQCVRSKKNCTGYPPPPRTKIFEEVRIAPRPPGPQSAGNIAPSTIAIAPNQPVQSRPTAKIHVQGGHGLTPPQTPVERHVLPVQSNSLTIHRPSTILFDPQDGQYFQLFQEHTANELSGFFDSSFWTRSVLQACYSEDAIRHSVVAIGALYKTLEKMSESPPSSPSDSIDPLNNAYRHWEVAFRHYSLALNTLVNAGSQDQTSQRTSLMATVLLACFDSFIGDHKQAIVQIQNGLGLLEKLRAERRRAFLPKPEEPVEQDLIQMFTRLAIQAKSYDMAFHFPQPYVIRLTGQNTENPTSPPSDGGSPPPMSHPMIPERFSSLIEARLVWDALTEKFMRFTETLFTHTRSVSPMGILPMELMQLGRGFGQQIEAWSIAFEPILASRTAPGKSSQEKTGIAVLKMNMIMGKILFLMTFKDNEQAFDEFMPSFKYIVNLAMEVVGDEERRAMAQRCPDPQFCQHSSHADILGDNDFTAKHIKPSFSADLGIVPPLFVVATKCRDPVTRRQAVQLLMSSSRREGMWDSELAARIGLWIAKIEEDDSGFEEFTRPHSSSTSNPFADSPASSKFSMGSPGSRSNGSVDFGDDIPLGPGGNARWDANRRESTSVSSPNRNELRTIPAEKRVMVRAVEFDLRERVATLQCGTRGLIPGMPDLRTRATRITW